MIDVKKGNHTNLTDSPSIIDDHPSWSPDGRRIAFVSGNLTEGYYIYIMDADGRNRTRLYQSGGSPSWSPDGKGIIFSNRLNIYEILVIKIDGKNLRTLTSSADMCISKPIWLSQ